MSRRRDFITLVGGTAAVGWMRLPRCGVQLWRDSDRDILSARRIVLRAIALLYCAHEETGGV